ncbi:hypothetical protein Gorai_011504 [Gossypium raimondii]|uniref:Uncharacterized protein n=1 Tax=Gossypium raimondii TaxID=29730 RepID=A0A7J8PZ92_GOSRA|nr:hypothetical protein [Gossypium raimondii]
MNIAWSLWLHSNLLVRKGNVASFHSIISAADKFLQDWSDARRVGDGTQQHAAVGGMSSEHWVRPAAD